MVPSLTHCPPLPHPLQSAGKTSVLERLSGVDLPRGAGMVTRCALVLRMVSARAGSAPYALIRGGSVGGTEGLRVELHEVAAHVTSITNTLAAEGEISQESIHLTVVSPHVPDLTLIDLPGIVCALERRAGEAHPPPSG